VWVSSNERIQGGEELWGAIVGIKGVRRFVENFHPKREKSFLSGRGKDIKGGGWMMGYWVGGKRINRRDLGLRQTGSIGLIRG